MKNIKKIFSLIIVFLFMAVLVSCSDVNEENFEKIKPNMSYSDVVSILGEAHDKKTVGSYIVYYWFEDTESVVEYNKEIADGEEIYCIQVIVDDGVVVTTKSSTKEILK